MSSEKKSPQRRKTPCLGPERQELPGCGCCTESLLVWAVCCELLTSPPQTCIMCSNAACLRPYRSHKCRYQRLHCRGHIARLRGQKFAYTHAGVDYVRKCFFTDIRSPFCFTEPSLTSNGRFRTSTTRCRQDPDRVRNDVLELSKHCKTLVPKRGTVGE